MVARRPYRAGLVVDDDKGDAVFVVDDKVEENLLCRLKARVARGRNGVVVSVEELAAGCCLAAFVAAVVAPHAWRVNGWVGGVGG